ncbi:MAG: Seryl-tRNA synthetase [uncultured Thermomicrobiales bacterium]|uniref:Serine--tRNA ligase n=1 Tax=uncultured Thermomicrobiales bacterium TaxID=1645740 RepID=A0A6J4UQI1_9BACT|nr:MAG: Seryl-tRNA synthetase [uncultured Thermomicrobiales bacterium]
MIDLHLIRTQPDYVRAQIARLHADAPIDEIIALDGQRRDLIGEAEALKAQRNAGSKAVGRAKDPTERERLKDEMRALGDRIGELDDRLRTVDDALLQAQLRVPNLPAEQVPDGASEDDNIVTAEIGERRVFDFAPQPHWDLAEKLGIIDFERGVKVAGTRNYILRGDGARLQRALITWMLDLHTREHGYQEVYPPFLVPSPMLYGNGSLPKFADTLFHDAEEDKWLIPTAEVPITNMYRDEILDEAILPIYHVAYTPCFRREQLSGGRDVRGIKRGFQFDKVEMVKFVTPETSDEEYQKLQADAEAVLRALGLPYRILQICAADLSFTAANKVDLEVWAPGSDEWLEVSSVATFHDFQARRANLRYRPTGGRPQYLHTLNGSGLALPRVMIAIMENYQNADGTFAVPDVLRPYLRDQEEIGVQPPVGNGARDLAGLATVQ